MKTDMCAGLFRRSCREPNGPASDACICRKARSELYTHMKLGSMTKIDFTEVGSSK